MAMRSVKPVAASLKGAATRCSAVPPVTETPRARSASVMGRASPSFFSSTAPRSAPASAMAASPCFVPSTGAPLVGPAGRRARPERSPATPPGLAQAATRRSQPRSPKRSCW